MTGLRLQSYYATIFPPEGEARVEPFILDGDWLLDLPRAEKAIEVNRSRFEEQATKLAMELEPGQSATIKDHWDRQVDAPKLGNHRNDPHFWALGTFTIQSEATISVSKDTNGDVSVQIDASHKAIDTYDFPDEEENLITIATQAGLA